jgi:hypothetical protein
MNLEKILPPIIPIKINNAVDRYGFSYILANQLNMKSVPRSFANWIHGWNWWENITAETLSCHKLPKDISIITNNELEKVALNKEGFKNVISGGLPFSYVTKIHRNRVDNSLLVFPPHSAEVETLTTNQEDYFDYIESIKNDFDKIFISIFGLDLDKSMHKAAIKRGFNIIKSLHPSDANGLIRLRIILDSFKYVTSNTMGSHMLYALYADCNFSFSGPFYGYEESVSLANGNPHKHTKEYIEYMLYTQSESYVKLKFDEYFVQHPKMGIQRLEFAKKMIGEENKLSEESLKKVLGWNIEGQLKGYAKGAFRRIKSKIK